MTVSVLVGSFVEERIIVFYLPRVENVEGCCLGEQWKAHDGDGVLNVRGGGGE